MDFKEYVSGEFKQQQYQYKSFMPTLINHSWEISDSRVSMLLSQADNKLGELNAFSQLVPDVDFFIMKIIKNGCIKPIY